MKKVILLVALFVSAYLLRKKSRKFRIDYIRSYGKRLICRWSVFLAWISSKFLVSLLDEGDKDERINGLMKMRATSDLK